jgi:peptide-methionine (S)-S-oxide reductase
MPDPEFTQPLLKEALQAIDNGNEAALRQLLTSHPQLVNERMDNPTEGYFKEPYLLWFIADNPIRNGELPSNITDIASLLVEYVQHNTKEGRQLQLDYALGLVATGSVPRRVACRQH